MKSTRSIVSCCCLGAALLLACGCNKETTVQGPAGRELTISQPASVSVEQGKTAEVTVSITRKNLTEPVGVSFAKLPAGVTVVDATKDIVGDKGTYILQADKSAALVENHQAEVTVKGPENITATQSLKITVKEMKAP